VTEHKMVAPPSAIEERFERALGRYTLAGPADPVSAAADRDYRDTIKTEYERRFRHAAVGHRPAVVKAAVDEIRRAVDAGGAKAGAAAALDLGARLGVRVR
jgi:hypothetical protein